MKINKTHQVQLTYFYQVKNKEFIVRWQVLNKLNKQHIKSSSTNLPIIIIDDTSGLGKKKPNARMSKHLYKSMSPRGQNPPIPHILRAITLINPTAVKNCSALPEQWRAFRERLDSLRLCICQQTGSFVFIFSLLFFVN